MTNETVLLENENATVLVGGRHSPTYAHSFGYSPENFREISREYSTDYSRPFLSVVTFSEEKATDYYSVDEVIQTMTGGPTKLEEILDGLKGKSFDRAEITRDSDFTIGTADTEIEEKYRMRCPEDNGRLFLAWLAHGAFSNGNFRSPNNVSLVSGIISALSTTGPNLKGNPFKQFVALSNFYDRYLGQHTNYSTHLPEVRLKYDLFFAAEDFMELDRQRKESFDDSFAYRLEKECLTRLQSALSPSGITSLDDIKARVKEFERNYFPGEFEKAAAEIRQTRSWLKSLKSDGGKQK